MVPKIQFQPCFHRNNTWVTTVLGWLPYIVMYLHCIKMAKKGEDVPANVVLVEDDDDDDNWPESEL